MTIYVFDLKSKLVELANWQNKPDRVVMPYVFNTHNLCQFAIIIKNTYFFIKIKDLNRHSLIVNSSQFMTIQIL